MIIGHANAVTAILVALITTAIPKTENPKTIKWIEQEALDGDLSTQTLSEERARDTEKALLLLD